MASSFGQYQNGVAPVSGISEAGSNIGRTYMSGMDALTRGLSEGIKSYGDSKAEREMHIGEIEGIANQAKTLADYAAKNPEYKDFVDKEGVNISNTLAELKKAPEMSLGQLRGMVAKAKVDFSGFGQRFQMYSMAKNDNEVRAGIEALRPENNPTTKLTEQTVKIALNNFKSGVSYKTNEMGYIQTLNQLKEQGVDIDIPTQLEAYRKAVENAANEAGKKDPTALTMLDQVSSARKMDNATSPDTEGYSQAEQFVATPAYSNIKPVSNVKPEEIKPYFKSADIQKELDSVQEKIKQINIKNSQGLELTAPAGTETLGSIADWTGSITGYGTKGLVDNEGLRSYVKGIKASAGITGQISPNSIESLVRDFHKKDNESAGLASSLNLVNEMSKIPTLGFTGAVQSAFEGLRGFRELTTGEEQAIKDSARKIDSEERGWTSNDTLNKLKTREKELTTNLSLQKANEETVQKANQTISEQASAANKYPEYNLTGDVTTPEGSMQAVGTRQVEVPITSAERNQRAIDFMTQRLGYRDANGNLVTPASVEKILGSIGNQTQTTYNEAGDRIIKTPDGKYHVISAKEVSSEERRKAIAGQFGTVNRETGKLEYASIIPNSPFKYAGQWTGSEKELEKFKEINVSGTMALTALDRLEVLIKNHPLQLKNPLSVEYKEAKSLIAQAYGGTKETLGLTGIMAKFKMDFLKDVLPDANSILERPEQSLGKLAITRQKFGQYLSSNASVNGLKFSSHPKYLPPNANDDGKQSISELRKAINK